MRWKDWAGYHAVCFYGDSHDSEYFALRHAAGLIDVSPLYKYDVTGQDAARFLAYVTVRDVSRMKDGRVSYTCWCDDDGKVVDDGTVTRLSDGHFRVTAAEPSLSWFSRLARRFDVQIEDVSAKLAALSLQGPNSRGILKSCVEGIDMAALKFFGVESGRIAGLPVWVSRTGYTGDLGYEIWAASEAAEELYDRLVAAGTPFQMLPCGLDAMDVARIEAGFIMNGVDYYSANHVLIEDRKSSPYELGLGWTVELEREAPFMGQAALRREKERGSAWALVCLDVDWDETEALFASYGLPPEIGSKAWRDGKPVYDQTGNWIGMATSGAWSPTLKKNLALAQVKTPLSKEGTPLKIEQTVQFRRHTVTATVGKPPFFNPSRKRS
jgi:aminomethyltransferase